MRPYVTSAYPGDKIQTEILMDPGEKYGNDEGDFYKVAIFENPDGESFRVKGKSDQCPTGNMTFSSLEQLEEFHRHIGDYITRERQRRSIG